MAKKNKRARRRNSSIAKVFDFFGVRSSGKPILSRRSLTEDIGWENLSKNRDRSSEQNTHYFGSDGLDELLPEEHQPSTDPRQMNSFANFSGTDGLDEDPLSKSTIKTIPFANFSGADGLDPLPPASAASLRSPIPNQEKENFVQRLINIFSSDKENKRQGKLTKGIASSFSGPLSGASSATNPGFPFHRQKPKMRSKRQNRIGFSK